MSFKRTITAVAGGLFAFVAGTALGQSVGQPTPPPQICVNGQCTPTATPPAQGGGSIKWTPGHYMASYQKIYPGDTMSKVQFEMDDLNNQDAILGYRLYITWGALEPTKGNYNFAVLDAILARLKTAYNKPKRMVVYPIMYNYGALGNNDGSVIPLYLQQDPAYGASPVPGSYGWWGANSNGASTGMYTAALYNPAVMARFIALVQALGAHYDADPYVEALQIQEDATIVQGALGAGSKDPQYSDSGFLTQLETLLTAATGAFPHTNITMDNSYFGSISPTIALEQWMAANRIEPGAADTWGQSGISALGINHQNWGLQTYMGLAQYGGTDMRPTMRAMMAIESPDMTGNYFKKYGGPWTPVDIITALNQTYFASHAFWTRMTGTQAPAAGTWLNVAAACAANPLTHTAYPGNYP